MACAFAACRVAFGPCFRRKYKTPIIAANQMRDDLAGWVFGIFVLGLERDGPQRKGRMRRDKINLACGYLGWPVYKIPGWRFTFDLPFNIYVSVVSF